MWIKKPVILTDSLFLATKIVVVQNKLQLAKSPLARVFSYKKTLTFLFILSNSS